MKYIKLATCSCVRGLYSMAFGLTPWAHAIPGKGCEMISNILVW